MSRFKIYDENDNFIGEYIGDFVEISGQFRSYNSYENGDNKLILTVFAKDIALCESELSKNPNSLFLNGYVCKEPCFSKRLY